jgi:hypothetical protein
MRLISILLVASALLVCAEETAAGRGGQGRVEVGARFQEAVWLCLDSGAFAKRKDSLPLRD